MSHLGQVSVGARDLDRFVEYCGREEVDDIRRRAEVFKDRMGDRVVWNVNSTAVGGGVAEMLHPLLGYARGLGIDVRWTVIEGNPEFFAITKRLHHALHGSAGDGLELGEAEREAYAATLESNAAELAAVVTRGDVVILHDPQTAGLAPFLMADGALVLWRCHVGPDDEEEQHVQRGWEFLEPWLRDVPACIFSRESYIPEVLRRGRCHVIQPSIDAFSVKNRVLDERTVRSILVHAGLVEGPMPDPPSLGFDRPDGTRARVQRHADVVRLGRAPEWDTPLVVQVSRWDPLKDMAGVLEGFATMVHEGSSPPSELVLVGPNVHGVADDPEAPATFGDVQERWRALPHGIRDRVHLAMLPTQDPDENAAMVNALQRHASVIVQKSLHEGFGLTVTEAMWKSRPVLASAVGGIVDQVVDGESGELLRKPDDLKGFASRLAGLLSDRSRAERLGAAARERVKERFLGMRHLSDYENLILSLMDDA